MTVQVDGWRCGKNNMVSRTVKDLFKSLCIAYHWFTVVKTVNWDCDNTSSTKRYIKTRDRCLWWVGLESCVNWEQNALLYHFVSQKMCYRLIQSSFFDYLHKSFDTNGITKIAFLPRRPRCWIPLRCRKACHHVNHTHGSKSKNRHSADGETHRYSIKKAAHPHDVKVPTSSSRWNTLVTRCGLQRRLWRGKPWCLVHENSGNASTAFLLWIQLAVDFGAESNDCQALFLGWSHMSSLQHIHTGTHSLSSFHAYNRSICHYCHKVQLILMNKNQNTDFSDTFEMLATLAQL